MFKLFLMLNKGLMSVPLVGEYHTVVSAVDMAEIISRHLYQGQAIEVQVYTTADNNPRFIHVLTVKGQRS